MEEETIKIIEFISQTFDKAGKKMAVIGLSGGVDSATVLALTCKALSPTRILVFFLPSKQTPVANNDLVVSLVKQFKIPIGNFKVVNIAGMVQKTWRTINRSTERIEKVASINRIRLANIQVRIRMMVLFDQAKKYDGLVMGTENRSEKMLGYFTRFGDEASDVEPIKHLFKTEVVVLAKNLGIPKEIRDKKPSADLYQGQTDEKELGFSYETADPILKLVNKGYTAKAMIEQGLEKTLVKLVLTRLEEVKFKSETPYTLAGFLDTGLSALRAHLTHKRRRTTLPASTTRRE